MSDALRSKVCGYVVTDERGDEALFKQHMRAEKYATCVRRGEVDGVVRLRDALDALAAAGCRRCSDEEKGV